MTNRIISRVSFGTVDHLSNGRAAWNVVTSMNDGEALNFGLESHLSHDQRYDRAEEFMELIFKLWDSWEEGALKLDRANGVYADPAKVHYVKHEGTYFKSRGPLNIPRGPQGRPVIIQAGASDRGRAFAVKWAEIIFNISPTREHMKRSTEGVREESAAAEPAGGKLQVADRDHALCRPHPRGGAGKERYGQRARRSDGRAIDAFGALQC